MFSAASKQDCFNEKAGCAMGALRLLGFVTLTTVMVPIHQVMMLWHKTDPYETPRLYYRILVGILGSRVRVHGRMETKRPVMFVSNHTSYLDIPMLGSVIPAAFVAKSEVASWPAIGWLARLQGTLFVERNARLKVHGQHDMLNEHLASGKSMILFPEGTSSVGLEVLPFKSSLFGLTDKASSDLIIQPVSVICSQLDGMPITRAWRPLYAWYGDMTFMKHLWNAFKTGRFTVDVTFHAPVKRADFADRKALALYCQRQIARGIEQSLTGRAVSQKPVPQLPPPSARPIEAH